MDRPCGALALSNRIDDFFAAVGKVSSGVNFGVARSSRLRIHFEAASVKLEPSDSGKELFELALARRNQDEADFERVALAPESGS
jgi:hypothetical protein